MKASASAAARRYARALFDVALAKGEADVLGPELARAAELLAGRPDLVQALDHPAVPVERKTAIVSAVWKQSPSDLLRRLLVVLAERNRLELVPQIQSRFAELWNTHRGVVLAEAVTAVPLPTAEATRLAGTLGQASGRRVELKVAVDPEVLGGVLVRMEGRVYDGTVRGRLRALREQLRGEAAGR